MELRYDQTLPPGLADLAAQESLTPGQVEQLRRMYGTIRGHRPTTLEEWQPLYRAVKEYLTDES